ncbi:MAG: hypothetical protein WAM69_18775 [Candidatus Sulfotelmatobacter sp.]
MNHENEQRLADRQAWDGGKLEQELDAALANFAAGEPRAGIEERILANLRAEREHASARAWWRRPALGVAAGVVIVAAILLASRSGKPNLVVTGQRPATSAQSDEQTATRLAANEVSSPSHPSALHPSAPLAMKKPARRRIRRSEIVLASGPRLDQFPSPRPLSEQEKLLVRYVQQFPKEAILIAKAQAESEKEMEDFGKDQPSGTNATEQRQQER